jgi:hypothetical protein
MNADFLIWFGYVASGIIALSMTMNSIVKFRWINLVGALSFATYGFLINAIPVTFLNGFIALVDIYYLSKIYSKKSTLKPLRYEAITNICLSFLISTKRRFRNFSRDFLINPK